MANESADAQNAPDPGAGSDALLEQEENALTAQAEQARVEQEHG